MMSSRRALPVGVVGLVALAALAILPRPAAAEEGPQPGTPPAASLTTVTCAPESGAPAGERHVCPADTSSGVTLVRSIGASSCLLGKTWGYDDGAVWVKDGCAAEFVVGSPGSTPQAPPPIAGQPQPPQPITAAEQPEPEPQEPERSSYSAFDASGTGFLVGRSEFGELRLGGYALVRYINQMGEDEFTDHLGNVRPVDGRNDIQFHRAMLHFRGWLLSKKFRYQITSWTVMSTDQSTLYGFVGYQFHKAFNLYGGINGIGGSRTLYGSHPFWLANDRVMADELFRGAYTTGVWANGEVLPGLWYHLSVGNNFSTLGITAKQLDRRPATGGSIWWMPTTHEYGPNGSYDDWEYHEKLATRFGMTTAQSRENRQELDDKKPENTQVRMADSLALFDTGSLAPGVTVNEADVRLLSVDLGMKYRGIFVQTELYSRWINGFDADGPLPVDEVHDTGFYLQAAFYPIKQKLELYASTSWVYGDEDAGYSTSHEYLAGANIYWFNRRDVRTNLQVISVDRSAANSTFGFYVGGQTGTTVSVATSFLY